MANFIAMGISFLTYLTLYLSVVHMLERSLLERKYKIGNFFSTTFICIRFFLKIEMSYLEKYF